MNNPKQCEAFYTDVLTVVNRYREEFDLRPWEIVGLLHALAFESAQFPEWGDVDFTPDDDFLGEQGKRDIDDELT